MITEKLLKIALTILLFSCYACSQKVVNETPDPGSYLVKKIDGQISIDGLGEEAFWKEANLLSDFHYPWRNEESPLTEFRAIWNTETLYFLYKVVDKEIITIQDSSLSEEMQAVASDRVEIFFKSDDKMNPYYAFEMDALGRLFDSKGKYYREIDSDWDWPEGEIKIAATKTEKGYMLEGAISLSSLEELGMKKGNLLLAGLYRGEYLHEDEEIKVRWISWIKPDSEKPDFHIPSSFGKLKLLD